MRVGICEDDKFDADHLAHLLNKWSKRNGINVNTIIYDSAETLLINESSYIFDVLFLDIQMGTISGLELASIIRSRDEMTVLVFTSRLREYIINGYDVNALKYMIKPIEESELFLVMDRAARMVDSRTNSFLLLGNGNEVARYAIKDIFYIDSQGHYINLHGKFGTYRYREKIGTLENKLPSLSFIRCHRTIMVHIRYIAIINKRNVQLADPNRTILPISQPYWSRLNQAFLEYYGRRDV